MAIKDDILMSVRAPVGPINISTQEICIGRGLAAIRVNKDFALNDYIFYILKDYEKSIKGNTGSTFSSINRRDIQEIKIPLPPIKIQQEIVEELDGYQNIIAGARMVVENWKPHIDIDPEWQMVELGEVCENLDSQRIPINSKERKKGLIPYYGASGIVDYVDDFIFNEDLLLVSEDGANLLARVTPIAFSVSGKTWVNNHAHVLRFKSKITQLFVENYLNLINIEQYVTGSAQPKLNQANLNRIPIPLPDQEIQNRIINKIEEEKRAMESNKYLISNFKEKIRNKISKVWGEE